MPEINTETFKDTRKEWPHCKCCGDVLYDFTQYIRDNQGRLVPTDYCCDCWWDLHHRPS